MDGQHVGVSTEDDEDVGVASMLPIRPRTGMFSVLPAMGRSASRRPRATTHICCQRSARTRRKPARATGWPTPSHSKVSSQVIEQARIQGIESCPHVACPTPSCNESAAYFVVVTGRGSHGLHRSRLWKTTAPTRRPLGATALDRSGNVFETLVDGARHSATASLRAVSATLSRSNSAATTSTSIPRMRPNSSLRPASRIS